MSPAVRPTGDLGVLPSVHVPPRASEASVQPCDLSCGYARALNDSLYSDDWLWCSHPQRSLRLVHAGRDCPRFQAQAPTASES